MQRHYVIRPDFASFDDKKRENKIVEITSKPFLEVRSKYLWNGPVYYPIEDQLSELVPDNVEAKMYKSKSTPTNMMKPMPFSISLLYIIDQKTKNCIEKLDVPKNQYFTRNCYLKNYEKYNFSNKFTNKSTPISPLYKIDILQTQLNTGFLQNNWRPGGTTMILLKVLIFKGIFFTL